MNAKLLAVDPEMQALIGQRPVVLVVLDGWGEGPQDDTNAIHRARIPVMDSIRRPSNLVVAGMKVYDEDTSFPPLQIMGPVTISDAFPTLVTLTGLSQFRVAETTKFPHATFFLNGGRRDPLNPELEMYALVPSQNVAKYAQAPEMSAVGVADAAIRAIESGQHRYLSLLLIQGTRGDMD